MIDMGVLVRTAAKRDERVQIRRCVGDYVANGAGLAVVSGGRLLGSESQRRYQAAFAIGDKRSMQQDPEFGVRQLVDIAVKALSPGINDPTTVIECLDRLSSVLFCAVRRDSPPRWCAR